MDTLYCNSVQYGTGAINHVRGVDLASSYLTLFGNAFASGHPMPLWDWLEKKAHALISVGGADLEAVWLKAIEPTIKEIARCQLSS
ncbi:hypothetical protein CDL15_Pgr010938 [Punica granatum]|uniref:Uncharacterized protein n=1 Tax=Punica granatum TaxID=22663 RepID=A0A218XMH4_PUNGR|nr:hypothetical protein CDL15_Pgr010938 [Punica granatum]